MVRIFDEYENIEQIKNMTVPQMEHLAGEIREFLIDGVSKTGGHLASNLGVVELTVSLYHAFNFDEDKLIWDVGHQSYVHKILTGRKDKFDTLRKYRGLSGFPKTQESKYDMFETGHSSTSISAALGMARARDLKKENYEVISVIGDGALTGGMAFEALNDTGYSKTKLIIVLNDNQMSISKNVGGLSTYLSKIRLDPMYNKFKDEVDHTLRKIPSIGRGMANSIEKIKDGIKQIIVPGMLFEDMGIKYLGPIDGHNIKELTKTFALAKHTKGPVLIHVITKKGKGYSYAEKNPNKYHGVGCFDCESGEIAVSKKLTYSSIFGDTLTALAEEQSNIVAITAAMPDGTGLRNFSEKISERFFDVGIAEQHAVTMASGMAKEGMKPVVAVYSTFLQRAYDQILHDVCIQKLPVILAIDRAGLVGEDGETHQGLFDLSYLTHMPNMTVLSPKCIEELKVMLKWAVVQDFPLAIRYPRGGDYENLNLAPIQRLIKGKWEIISDEGDICMIAVGKMVQHAILAKEKLNRLGVKVGIVNACFVKPIDNELLKQLTARYKYIVTIEDNIVHGGFGSLVLEYINTLNYHGKVVNLGFPDAFIQHGSLDILFKLYGLDPQGICNEILKLV